MAAVMPLVLVTTCLMYRNRFFGRISWWVTSWAMKLISIVSPSDFFELQFDTATLIIQSFRMIKATCRGCKQRFISDPLYVIIWYLVGLGFTCNIIQ